MKVPENADTILRLQDIAFKKVKILSTSVPVLKHYDSEKNLTK